MPSSWPSSTKRNSPRRRGPRKLALIRRATFDLTGLPPTPEEIDAFLADQSPDAFAKVVDRLLASPDYGERWGRHWLDVVRYADTAGDASDYPIPQAYPLSRLRDRRLQSRQAVRPVPPRADRRRPSARASANPRSGNTPIATGYLAAARRFNVNPLQNMHLTIDDTIDNLGKTVLGLTHRLRALPRSQVRPHPERRLLRDLRHFPEHDNIRSPAPRRITSRRT